MPNLINREPYQSIAIPKRLFEQAHLENQQLQFKIIEEGLLISPIKSVRQNWQESIEAILTEHGSEKLDHEWLDAPLVSNKEWEW
ncbi:hypothetical protein BGP_0070 [Beggiatoa sp. PS]|nr:hypothetical protein BGP_0070 [Beggiatoa sp. PS]